MKDLVSIKISREVFDALSDEQYLRKKAGRKASQDEIVEEWYKAQSAYPKQVTGEMTQVLCQNSQNKTSHNRLSLGPSQLVEIREALNRALALIDGVLDGEDIADTIGELEAELEAIDPLGGDVGKDRKDPPPHGVVKPKGRRAQ